MKGASIAGLLIVAILIGSGVGFLYGSSNVRNVTSVSTTILTSATTTFGSVSTQTITVTSNVVSTETTVSRIRVRPAGSLERNDGPLSGSESSRQLHHRRWIPLLRWRERKLHLLRAVSSNSFGEWYRRLRLPGTDWRSNLRRERELHLLHWRGLPGAGKPDFGLLRPEC